MLFSFSFICIVRFEQFTISVDFDFIFLFLHFGIQTEQVAVAFANYHLCCSVVVHNSHFIMLNIKHVFLFDSFESLPKIWLIISIHVCRCPETRSEWSTFTDFFQSILKYWIPTSRFSFETRIKFGVLIIMLANPTLWTYPKSHKLIASWYALKSNTKYDMVREIESEVALTYFVAIHLWCLMIREISIFMLSIRKPILNIKHSLLLREPLNSMYVNKWKSVHSAFISKTDACRCNRANAQETLLCLLWMYARFLGK